MRIPASWFGTLHYPSRCEKRLRLHWQGVPTSPPGPFDELLIELGPQARTTASLNLPRIPGPLPGAKASRANGRSTGATTNRSLSAIAANYRPGCRQFPLLGREPRLHVADAGWLAHIETPNWPRASTILKSLASCISMASCTNNSAASRQKPWKRCSAMVKSFRSLTREESRLWGRFGSC